MNRSERATKGARTINEDSTLQHHCSINMGYQMGWKSGDMTSRLSLAGAATSIIFVATKVLSWQTQNTSFVATKICLSWQSCCHDKIKFVLTNISCDKSFVVTKHFCRNNTFVTTDKKHTFVATKLLSQQNLYLWQLPPVTLCTHMYSLWTSVIKLQRANIHTACTFPVATQLKGNKNWRRKLTWKQSCMLHWVVLSSIFINKKLILGGGIGEERTRNLGSN